MGRSTASCFKIITCSSDAVDEDDDIEASESKGSSDKRGWSFRKRSARHRVLSNIVISEMPSSLNKDGPETATVNLETQPNAAFQEKTSAMGWTDEKPRLSTSANLKVSDTRVATENDTMHDVDPDESVIVIIQAAIRGFLAQRELLKLKNVVKLQAAVRGHLVRRQAVGTLHCLQAIVKMQTLVRARQARVSSDGKLDGNHVKDDHNSKLLEKGDLLAKPNVRYTSIEKLLKNKFAHQLLESTPRTKHIHIKCDPSRSDSSWKWLERWMSVSSMGVEQPQKPGLRMEQHEEDKDECSGCEVETEFPSGDSESTDLKATIRETVVPSKGEDTLMTYDADNVAFQACEPASSTISDNLELPQPENSGTSNLKESLDLLPNQTKQSDSISQMELKSNTSKPEMENEHSACSVKSLASEQVETEGKKFVFGMRKATNPAFIAVKSKFEELSSTANFARSTSTYSQDVGVESNSDAVSYAMDNAVGTMEIGLAENSVLHTSRVKVGGSECGTELSITSTLDSPESSEIGAMGVEQEAILSEKGNSNPDITRTLDIEANGVTTIPGSDSSYSILVQPEKLDDVNGANGKPVISFTAVDSLHEQLNVQIELGSETGHKMYKSSPEASPRSHMTVPEFQVTPSSQVSVKTERTKSERGSTNQKRRSNHDSVTRSSLERLPKENKTGKRRNSFGSGRPDYVDQEPRDSNSSNSLPSYMQATESARAKALATSSPRSSPDVQDKDIYIKKRHSLPASNGRQGSPRIQRSTSQAQQGAKGNGQLHERKWQR
ncbi:hypothetical protein ACSBR2_000254 [Camellia fascicularis]